MNRRVGRRAWYLKQYADAIRHSSVMDNMSKVGHIARVSRGATWRWSAVLLASLSGSAGCGQSDKVQVAGKVLYKDGTAPKGGVCVVQFLPAADSPAKIRKAASGEIRDDGSFEAYTRKPGDGVFLGKYDVTFAVLKSPMDPASLIDLKYTKASTTPFHIAIEDDVTDLTLQIDPIRSSR